MAEDSSDSGNKPGTANGLDRRTILLSGASLFALAAVGTNAAQAADQPKPQAAPSGSQPNVLFIMGDDIGWFNIGAYNRGMMAGKTPNLDKLASEGMLFQSYYAEASCTAGRANFITGELPMRTGLTTVGQAGATVGMPDKAPTIATALKTMGYTTGQFGKNHLGDRNEYLPTVHGFDEFWGYLYHLDAMEDPFHPNYPQNLKDKVGPRNLLHTFATRYRRSDCRSALGQGRQAEDHRRGTAAAASDRRHQIQHGDGRRGHSRQDHRFHRQGQSRRQAVLRLVSTRRACTSSRISRRNTRGCATPRTAGRSRRPAWRRWTTASAPSCSISRIWARRQHHRRVHHRQRRRELHLARRRPDAVRRRQGHGARRRLPRALHPALARQGSGRQDRQRHHLGARLVPDLRRRGRQSQHRRGASRRQGSRRHRPTRCISTATTSSTSSPASRRRSATKSSTSPRRRSARCASTTTNTASSISRKAGSAIRSRSIGRS